MTRAPHVDAFSCYCVDLADADVHRLIREQRWQELERLGVGQVCTGCRADYRAIKALLRGRGAEHDAEGSQGMSVTQDGTGMAESQL
jgi:bacterioferritin-associated ferredoxin